jgi:hypothetical protein
MFLRRIFRRKPKAPPEIPEVKKFTLDSLESEIGNLKKRKFEAIKETAKPKIDGITEACNNIKKSVENLEKAEITEAVHPRIEKTTLEARRLLIDKVNRAFEGVSWPHDLTWQSLSAFNDSVTRAVNLLIRANVMHGRFAATLFKQQVRDLSYSIRRLHELVIGLDEFLKEKGDEFRALEEVSSKIAEQRDLLQRIESLHVRRKSLGQQAKDLENELVAKKKELEKLVVSKDFKQLEDFKRELKRIEGELLELKSEVVRIFSSLGRPLKKMRKLWLTEEHQASREQTQTLELCLADPFEAFLADEKGLPTLTSLLRVLGDSIESGKIPFDPREQRKKLGEVREVLERGTLLELKEKYTKLLAEKNARKRKYETSPLLKEKARLERSLKINQLELARIRSELDAISKTIEESRQKIQRNKIELENKARGALGVELKIV